MTLEIANKLVELRKSHGVSQEELASSLGISRQAISKWERGEASPDIDNIILLSRFYGVSIDELLCREQEFESAAEGAIPDPEPPRGEPEDEPEAAAASPLRVEPIPEDGARFASVKSVEVNARADIDVFGVEGDEVSVRLEGSKKEQEECSVYMDGSVLRIETPKFEHRIFFIRRVTLKIRLGLPQSMGRVAVKLAGGDARLTNAKAKDIALSTGGGDITAIGVRSKGLVLTTGGGDISVGDVFAGSAELRTGGGEIEADGVHSEGHLELRTGGGDMEVTCSAQSVSAITGGGDVKLGTEAKTVEAKSGGGDFEITALGPASVSVKTGGGDIELSLGGIEGAEFDIATAGGEAELLVGGRNVKHGRRIEATVGTGAAKIELRSGGGDITAKME